ncbi:hypothetical protein V7S43_015433 [Phytophthora oleae]|uniref:Uncharacterized protein n=1 Tax=Phytophthora oleae TaxID=2107226 RepID=A0ABD3F1E6_9STRA
MESSSTGTKRKLKENAFTAKAEDGTLKVKILRRDQRPADSLVVQLTPATTSKGRNRRSKTPPPSNSPPKPRPNRKHVPIFYDTQFRQTIKRGGSSQSHSSSTDESAAHSSSTGVPGIHSASSTDASEAAASSSTSSTFVSQLSDVRLRSTSSTSGDIGLAPRSNPLFVRNDSDGLGTLGELLRPYMASGSSGLRSSFPLEGGQTGTTSSAGLLVDQTAGLASALHQLASSSASYRSALDALSESNGRAASASDSTAARASSVSSTASDTHNGGMEHYKFDPFSALQTAIDHARRGSIGASSESTNRTKDMHREIGSPNSNARFYRLEPSGSSDSTHNHSTTGMGPPPELPPAFTLQNSLMGGGISRYTPSKSTVGADGKKDDTSNAENVAKDAIAALGPPPDGPPSFLLSSSLTGTSISILDLPKTNLSLDRLGSLTRLISQANEEAKDLDTTLSSPPKTNLRLHRLVSSIGMTSKDSETTRDVDTPASHTSADTSSTSSRTTHETRSTGSGAIELGPPPSGPPAFTIGNSLMGGGIELQPPAASVNTHNFDWKLHRSASSNGGDATSRAAATGGLSHGLRARLERSLASTQNDTDES